MFKKIRPQFLKSKSDRTLNILRHIGWSAFFKLGSVLINFLIVPLTIDYLNQDNYGVWLTISSFIGWFTLFDVGLGHGLRNKFAEAKARNEDELVKTYVSCAYFTIGLISTCFAIISVLISLFLDWSAIFNTSINLKGELKVLMPLIFIFFSLQLITKLIVTIYTADQHHSIQTKIDFITKLILYVFLLSLVKLVPPSILVYGAVFTVLPVIILVIFNYIGFSSKYKLYKPSYSLWKYEYIKEIVGLGFNFFIVQIAALVLFSTDNFIITKLFSPADVVPYNIAYKYFSIVLMGYSILITPYWSSFTDAYTKKEYDWIKNSIKTVQRIWLLIPIALIIMLFSANWFYRLWVGSDVEVPFTLSLSMAVFVLLMTYQSIYTYFINGSGKIRLQLYVGIVSIFVNIPLSIFLAKTMELGTSGVIIATTISLLMSVVLWPIQYKKIINQNASGIWNK